MKFSIEKLKNSLEFIDEKKKIVSMNGYAFIDELGKCIIMVYGEGRRDFMEEHLKGNTNEYDLKYRYIDIK